MSVSFGVEFEFDFIGEDNRRVTYHGERPLYVSRNWDWQNDYTASCELRSPVFTSLRQYVDECNDQFNGLIGEYETVGYRLVPYMCNDRGRSLGQHMHVGKPHTTLSRDSKRRLAKAIVPFYPFLAAIHAQPIPSHRGLTTTFARSLRLYGDVIDIDHYCEISDSHVGTVELRIFDSNIPQASLVCAWIVTEIAKRTLRNREQVDNSSIDLNAYDHERTRALRYGLVGLDITNYLRRLKSLLGNIDIPDIACIREALYLMARYRLNFYGVWRYSNARAYDYMRVQLSDCSKYLDNLLRVDNIQHRDKIAQWASEAGQIENLDQLIGLSIAVDRSLESYAREAEAEAEVERPVIRARLGRSEVRECLANDRYYICRIGDVRTMSLDEVAERISELLRDHGEGLVNVLSAREVIETSARFYVLVAFNPYRAVEEICGAIAVHVRSGEIRSLVVDRRFRRLGIARMLVEHVLRVLRDSGINRAHAYVRRENVASRALLESLGFRASGECDRSVLMTLNL